MTGVALEHYLRPGAWIDGLSGSLYLQLRNRLEEGMQIADLAVDAPLPSEREIARITGLSRVTVRKAIELLAEEGLIRQRHGVGSFVAPKPNRVEQSLSRLTSFSEDMQRRGLEATALWLERGVFLPTSYERTSLKLDPKVSVSRLGRLRLANGQPIAIERASLPTPLLPNPIAVEDSLYEVLELSGQRPSRAIQRISGIGIKGSDAEFLDIREGGAGLLIERISYHSDGHPVELVRSLYRGDAYDFVAELRLGHPDQDP